MLMSMNGREINVWRRVHGFPNKMLPGGYLVSTRGRCSGKFGIQDGWMWCSWIGMANPFGNLAIPNLLKMGGSQADGWRDRIMGINAKATLSAIMHPG